MRYFCIAIVLSASAATASPWRTKCAATLDAARKSAVKIDPAFAKVTVVSDEIGSEEQVKLKLGTDRPIPSVFLAGKAPGEAADWESTDETTSNGDYHYVANRKFATGHALMMLTIWKKPIAKQLVEVFRPALEACFSEK